MCKILAALSTIVFLESFPSWAGCVVPVDSDLAQFFSAAPADTPANDCPEAPSLQQSDLNMYWAVFSGRVVSRNLVLPSNDFPHAVEPTSGVTSGSCGHGHVALIIEPNEHWKGPVYPRFVLATSTCAIMKSFAMIGDEYLFFVRPSTEVVPWVESGERTRPLRCAETEKAALTAWLGKHHVP